MLRNRVGAVDQAAFDRAEADLVPRRAAIRPHLDPPTFDLAHLQAIHRWLFGDLFDWAGEIRESDQAKGETQFWPSDTLEERADKIFEWLHAGPLLHPEVDDDVFVTHISDLYLELNHLHPFRDGNGRTQRAFLNDVAWLSGRAIDWSVISRVDNDAASERAVGTQTALHLRKLLEPAIVKVDNVAQWRSVSVREMQILRSATASASAGH